MTSAHTERRKLQAAFIVAMSRATGELEKARIIRDAFLATMPRRGLAKLAQSEGVTLAELHKRRQQACDRLHAASHGLEIVESP